MFGSYLLMANRLSGIPMPMRTGVSLLPRLDFYWRLQLLRSKTLSHLGYVRYLMGKARITWSADMIRYRYDCEDSFGAVTLGRLKHLLYIAGKLISGRGLLG
jgi:hypothetical protein